VRFWDSSAIVPLLVREPSSDAIMAAYRQDPEVVAWWATQVECVSALTRLERAGNLPGRSMSVALRRLDELARAWQEVLPHDQVRMTATRLLRVHPLRAGDAFQLGAALAVAESHPETLPFVTLDDQLADAAEREGFPIDRPTARA
jgi:predicted nucleic acid-binding protein